MRYMKYNYNRQLAQFLNEDHYHTWWIMDEGLDKPYPQRYHNFICKYGTKRHKNDKTILGILMHNYSEAWEQICKPWIIATRSERKKLLKIHKGWCNCFVKYLHLAEMDYFDWCDENKRPW